MRDISIFENECHHCALRKLCGIILKYILGVIQQSVRLRACVCLRPFKPTRSTVEEIFFSRGWLLLNHGGEKITRH